MEEIRKWSFWRTRTFHDGCAWGLEKFLFWIISVFFDNYTTIFNSLLSIKAAIVTSVSQNINNTLLTFSDVIIVTFLCYIRVITRITLGVVIQICLVIISLSILIKMYSFFRRHMDNMSVMWEKYLKIFVSM